MWEVFLWFSCGKYWENTENAILWKISLWLKLWKILWKYWESNIVANISVVKIVENTVKLRKQYCGKYLYGYRYVLCKASHLGEKKDDCNIKQMHKYLDGCQYLLTGGQIWVWKLQLALTKFLWITDMPETFGQTKQIPVSRFCFLSK